MVKAYRRWLKRNDLADTKDNLVTFRAMMVAERAAEKAEAEKKTSLWGACPYDMHHQVYS